MPNHVINEITIHGVTLDEVRPLVSGKDAEIDFEVLLPLPLNYWHGNVGLQHEDAFPGTGLAAARETWGTKWNAYGLEGNTPIQVRGDDVVLTFETAWNHPRGWTVALFNKLGNKAITVRWLSEGGWPAFVEHYTANPEHGPDWKSEEIEEGGDEYRRLHNMLFGVEAFEDDDE